MTDPVLTIGRPSPEALDAALQRARTQDLTYPEVGATAGQMPSDYLRLRRRVRLGSGDDAFARAAQGLRHWRMHRLAGLVVHAGAPTAALGGVVTLAVPLGPVWRLASCRVVATVDEPARQGFVYGTLPGHPEVGEESFTVEQDAAGSVVFRLAVFSRLGAWDARLLPPASRAVQLFFTRRYLQAMRELAAGR